MTPLAQRIAIAKAVGWKQQEQFEDSFSKPTTKVSRGLMWTHPELPVPVRVLPNYLSDLNAMHEAENILTDNQAGTYLDNLIIVTEAKESFGFKPTEDRWNHWSVYHATASQRAEAFLRTLSLWEDSVPEPINP